LRVPRRTAAIVQGNDPAVTSDEDDRARRAILGERSRDDVVTENIKFLRMPMTRAELEYRSRMGIDRGIQADIGVGEGVMTINVDTTNC